MNQFEPALIGSLLTVAATLLATVITLWSKKWRTPTDAREDRSVELDYNDKTLAAQDKLVERFQKLLTDSDEKHSKELAELERRHTDKLTGMSSEIAELQGKVEIMNGERPGFIRCIQHLVRIIEKYGYEDEIGEIPVAARVSV